MTQTEPIPVRQQPAWAWLEGYAAKTENLRLAEMFRDDPGRSERFSADAFVTSWKDLLDRIGSRHKELSGAG
ncbi:MAG: hypothetical protein LBV78_15120 [Kitasatospora sp.]|jgi:hypothetical protein|nr:hypothetical protein [Kitasatospora sp.]